MNRLIYKFLKEVMEITKRELPESKRFATEMKKILKVYNRGKHKDKLTDINEDIKKMQSKMVVILEDQKIYKENLEETNRVGGQLVVEAENFGKETKKLKWYSWLYNQKYKLLIYGSLLLVIVLIILFVCRVFH